MKSMRLFQLLLATLATPHDAMACSSRLPAPGGEGSGVKKLNSAQGICLGIAFYAAAALVSPAQTYTTFSFDQADGVMPYMVGLVQGTNGDLYGTTTYGGKPKCANFFGCGTVFEFAPDGALTTLHVFGSTRKSSEGFSPYAGLIQATNGNFYGTTFYGGATGGGVVFEVTPAGEYSTLYDFCLQSGCPDGETLFAPVMQAKNGNLYGVTFEGGSYGAGTLFELTLAGTLTTVHNFCLETNCADGYRPEQGLVQASNGNLYGTAGGGANQGGTVFEVTPAGVFTTIHSFCSGPTCPEGAGPNAPLVQGANGNLYGTAIRAGVHNQGTVFEITPQGKVTTLYDFCSLANCADGGFPFAGLILASDGNFYGTTKSGGTSDFCLGRQDGCGTIFRITPAGELTTLHNFCSQPGCADGVVSNAGLLQASNGNFYGTTYSGGVYDNCFGLCGTIYELSVGLGPLVKTKQGSR